MNMKYTKLISSVFLAMTLLLASCHSITIEDQNAKEFSREYTEEWHYSLLYGIIEQPNQNPDFHKQCSKTGIGKVMMVESTSNIAVNKCLNSLVSGLIGLIIHFRQNTIYCNK